MLVLFCIEADFCNQILIFQLYIFGELQDLQAFAPLAIQNCNKNSSNFVVFLSNFSPKILFFNSTNIIEFCTDFDENKFLQNIVDNVENSEFQNVRISELSEIFLNSDRISTEF